MSKTYDIWGKLAETRARNRAIELADIEDGQHILEVAVGTGLGFYEIVRYSSVRCFINPEPSGGGQASEPLNDYIHFYIDINS